MTQLIWNLSAKKNSNYTADPSVGSIHNRGCAVDVTLQDLSTGAELDMPTEFDNFTNLASPLSSKCSSEQQQNRDLLINVMRKYNFLVDNFEWWHFNWHRWEEYPVLDVKFKSL